MFIVNKYNNAIIDITGGMISKLDNDRVYQIIFTRTSLFDQYEVLAEYKDKEERDKEFRLIIEAMHSNNNMYEIYKNRNKEMESQNG